jgi:hypothetical protein
MSHALQSEIVLATLATADDEERLQVVLVRQQDGSSAVSLLQQSWADGVGWYTQHAVQLAPDQVRQLRSVLGATPVSALGHSGTSSSRFDSRDDGGSGRLMTVPFPGRRAESA